MDVLLLAVPAHREQMRSAIDLKSITLTEAAAQPAAQSASVFCVVVMTASRLNVGQAHPPRAAQMSAMICWRVALGTTTALCWASQVAAVPERKEAVHSPLNKSPLERLPPLDAKSNARA